MAIEVEIKSWVRDKKLVEKNLKRFGGKLVKESHQLDHYYNSPIKNLITLEPPEYIRIREKNGKCVLAYHVVIGPNHAHEYETKCDDPKMVHKILENLGCKILGVIDKNRKTYVINYKGREVNICIDDVKDVGEMMEFEILVEHETETHSAEALIKELMDEFGITEKDKEVPRLSKIGTGKVKWPKKS